MSDPAHVPAILQEPRRHRYLKLIALFKIGKGVLLLLLGVSLVFLNMRTRWMDAISDWTADEILMEHSRAVTYLLNKLQAVLAGGALRATGFLALFYSAVLFTEGIGVYLEQRWAEWLMIIATAALIPLEVRHIWHRPGLVGGQREDRPAVRADHRAVGDPRVAVAEVLGMRDVADLVDLRGDDPNVHAQRSPPG